MVILQPARRGPHDDSGTLVFTRRVTYAITRHKDPDNQFDPRRGCRLSLQLQQLRFDPGEILGAAGDPHKVDVPLLASCGSDDVFCERQREGDAGTPGNKLVVCSVGVNHRNTVCSAHDRREGIEMLWILTELGETFRLPVEGPDDVELLVDRSVGRRNARRREWVGLEKAQRREGEEEVLAGIPNDAAFDAEDQDVDAIGVLVPLDRAIKRV